MSLQNFPYAVAANINDPMLAYVISVYGDGVHQFVPSTFDEFFPGGNAGSAQGLSYETIVGAFPFDITSYQTLFQSAGLWNPNWVGPQLTDPGDPSSGIMPTYTVTDDYTSLLNYSYAMCPAIGYDHIIVVIDNTNTIIGTQDYQAQQSAHASDYMTALAVIGAGYGIGAALDAAGYGAASLVQPPAVAPVAANPVYANPDTVDLFPQPTVQPEVSMGSEPLTPIQAPIATPDVPTSLPTSIDPNTLDYGDLNSTVPSGGQTAVLNSNPEMVVDPSTLDTVPQSLPSLTPTPTVSVPEVPDVSLPSSSSLFPASSQAPVSASSIFSGGPLTAQQTTALALAAIKAITGSNNPAINNVARALTSSGSTIAANSSNGMIQTLNSAGQVTSSLPPVGVPQLNTDGSYTINNGNGTYSVVQPNGTSATYSYPAGTAGLTGISAALQNPLILGSLALVAFAVLR